MRFQSRGAIPVFTGSPLMQSCLMPYVIDEILAMVRLAETCSHPALLVHVSGQVRDLGKAMEIAAVDLRDTDRDR